MNRSALILIPVLLAGCNVQAKHDRKDGDSNVSINGGEDGNVSFDTPIAKGEFALPADAIKSSDVDIDGVKLYPGSTIGGFNAEATGGRAVVNVRFRAPDGPDKVRAYFMDGFRDKRVEANASGNTITGKTSDGSQFVIDLKPAGAGSEGTLRIDGKDD